jgi:hypothetical protein
LGRENIFHPTIRNENLRQYSIDNGVIRVNCATTKIIVVKNTMFRIETFIRIPGPFLMGRLTARQKHIDTHELAFECTRFATFQSS